MKKKRRLPVITAFGALAAILAGPGAMPAAGGQRWQKYETSHGSGLTKEEACTEAGLVVKSLGADTCVERYRQGVMKEVKGGECTCPVQSEGYYHCRIEFVIACEAE